MGETPVPKMYILLEIPKLQKGVYIWQVTMLTKKDSRH
jgi:hypothetical protein